MANQNIDGGRRWSISRIIAAILLCLVLASAISFGIDKLITSNAKPKSDKIHQSKSVIKQPPKSFFNSAPTTSSTTNSSKAVSSSGQNTQSVSNSSQLTNTGPGDVAFYGFLIATPLTAIIYNSWLKRRLSR